MTISCNICPRKCGIDRTKKRGFCNEHGSIAIAKIMEHFSWEEPCLAGESGTFAVFFSGCNLRCDYCQNYEISRGNTGRIFSEYEFCDLIEKAQKTHSSIDLITPTHFADALISVFKKIDKKVPVIWNTNGYETLETIEKVASFVDVFLPDLKYSNDELGKKFSRCNNYFTYALPAIKKMCELKKDVLKNNQLVQGVMIRHLVLPGYVKNSFDVLDMMKEHFPNRLLSLMSQFTPNGKSELNRKITPIEYKAVLSHMQKLGLELGYTQDIESACEEFVPDFKQ